MPPLSLAQKFRQELGLGQQNVGARGTPQMSPPSTLDSSPVPGAPGGGFAGGATGGLDSLNYNRSTSFTGDAKDFLSSLYSARPRFVQQQGALLQQLGPQLRQSIFAASPELAAASQHIQNTFNDPYGGQQSTFQDAIRSAQAARGFTGGGSGVVGEEARYLSNYTQQRRDALLPQAQSFGNQMLGIAGLNGPPDLSLGAIGQLSLAQANLQFQQQTASQQSAYAERLYNDYNQQLSQSSQTPNNPFGAKLPSGGGRGSVSTVVGGSPFSSGRTFSGQSGGGNSAGTYDASGNLISSGNGLEFGKGVDRYTQAKILQASGKLNTEAAYLDFINAGTNNNARQVSSSFNGVAIG